MKLVGDIGGTKVLLALVDEDGSIVEKRRFASTDFSSFDDLIAAYLDEVAVPPDGGCLAVAGPVADDGCSAKITNLPWCIDAAVLGRRFGFDRLVLINDFAGVALGVCQLGSQDLYTLQAGVPHADGVRLVVGAGTGLGVAAVSGDCILSSEGGHIAFGPMDEEQARIWAALRREYGRVCVERVVSGPGLAAIHRILSGADETPERIGRLALAGDPLARRSVDAFFACYGAFAGDMALVFMARGGVYLAGGVTLKLLPLIVGSPFMTAFNTKAEHAGLVGKMSVQVVMDADVGLFGAAAALS